MAKKIAKQKKKAGRKIIKKTDNNKKEKQEIIFPTHNKQAHRNMWLGVIAFMLVILIFWGWSLKLSIEAINWKITKETSIAKETKESWDEIFKKTKIIEEKNKIKKQIKNTLEQIITE